MQFYSIIISVAFLLFFVYAIYLKICIRKKEENEKNTRAIANTYVSICYIDLPTDTFHEIHSMKYVREVIGKTGAAQEAMNKILEHGLVVETYVPRVKEFTTLETLPSRLKNKKIISEEAEGTVLGWNRSSFIPVDYDESGAVKSVLYTVQRIQGEVLSLRGQLNIEETLLECVLTLSKNTDPDNSINQLLVNVATFHNADRAYIFEIDDSKNTATNTFEWCKKGISPEIQNLQNLSINDIELFVNLCRDGLLKFADINYFSKDSNEYKLLEQQNITSLMCMPLFKGGKMIGFIGVDNPRINRGTDSILKSVSSFIVTELEKKLFIEELYDLSYKDMMTGVYNRHANMRDIEEFGDKEIKNVGIIYADVNGLKETNDTYDHEHGDRLIINAVNILKKYYGREEDKIYRVGGDEFVVISDNVLQDAFDENYSKMVEELGGDSILSTGKSWFESSRNISEHIKSAERDMYNTKKNYYKSHDRRA